MYFCYRNNQIIYSRLSQREGVSALLGGGRQHMNLQKFPKNHMKSRTF